MQQDILTPTFALVKVSHKKKTYKKDTGVAEDISDTAISRMHSYYEKLERKLHHAFLSGPRPPLLIPNKVDYESMPDQFLVQFDEVELVSDPLPPPPRVLKTPARFLDGGANPHTKRNSANVVMRLPHDVRTILPMRLGVMSVLSLGRIVCDRPGFSDEHALYPVGFASEREYVSSKNPSVKTVYRCEIRDGEEGPVFCVTASDDPKHPVVGESPTMCWAEVIRRINAARIARQHKPVYTTISGPEYFGINKPRLISLFEQLEGADKCAGYQFRYYDPVTRVLVGEEPTPDQGVKRASHKSHKRRLVLDNESPDKQQQQQKRGRSRSVSVTASGKRRKSHKKGLSHKKGAGAKAAALAAVPVRPRKPMVRKPRKQLYTYVVEPLVPAEQRYMVPEVLKTGPTCHHCGGERGDLLKCSKCAHLFHLRCVEPHYRPMSSAQKWLCIGCVSKKKGGADVPRKRGRPRKLVLEGPTILKPKKKIGRPRKVVAPSKVGNAGKAAVAEQKKKAVVVAPPAKAQSKQQPPQKKKKTIVTKKKVGRPPKKSAPTPRLSKKAKTKK